MAEPLPASLATPVGEAASPPAIAPAIAPASHGNMLLLVQLRWIAVAGQLLTIWVARNLLSISLPMVPLMAAPALLVLVNIGTLVMMGHGKRGYSYLELLGALLLDVQALAWQLYFTGGATNPFIFLFLLQIVIGVILLPPGWSWVVAVVAACDVIFLGFQAQGLALPTEETGFHFQLYLLGSLVCFLLDAVLLVLLVVRMDRNRRASDAALAHLRQQAAEEALVVRMGLLASGAAHELGTPLASMSVILGDWLRHPVLADEGDLAEDVGAMQAELARCKSILSGILMASGEVRGENPRATSVRAFLEDIIEDWRERTAVPIAAHDHFGSDLAIIADPALRQVIGNVIDNALEVSPGGIALSARRQDEALVLTVTDQGPGFPPAVLAALGRPYTSTKGRPGGGLGLFLVFTVLRTLGGRVEVANRPEGGAQVCLIIPLAPLAFSAKSGG